MSGFVRGRIRFHPGDKHAPNTGSPGAGNVLAAWGACASTVLSESDIKGRLFMPMRQKRVKRWIQKTLTELQPQSAH